VVVSGGGGHLKLWWREERVRHLEIKEGGGGGLPWRELTERGGCGGGGGFDSGVVDGEL
jgi:hypothetical protein